MKVIQAINDKVVVEVIMQEKVTSGGIILPVNVDKDPQSYGEVLSVGEEVENIKVGDIVIFHRNGGMAIMIDRKIMKVLVNKEIYGILKDVQEETTTPKVIHVVEYTKKGQLIPPINE